MNNDQIYDSIALANVTELVNTNAIGKNSPTGFQLYTAVYGWTGDLTFASQQDAIKALVPVCKSFLMKQGAQLRVAS
jgi:hypothetical protein